MDVPIMDHFRIRLPDWARELAQSRREFFASLEDRMRFAIELSGNNVRHGTGGPFGAAVFERDTGALLAVGVNVVVPQSCSVAHAEIVALCLAQARLRSWTLAGEGLRPAQLVSSAEPCAMCLGALPWSGVEELVFGAREADSREVGFDEGMKPESWMRGLEARGIKVVSDILRDEASEVLRDYAASGGIVYNR